MQSDKQPEIDCPRVMQMIRDAMHELAMRYMMGMTDEADQKMLAAFGYGPRFDGFLEPARRDDA